MREGKGGDGDSDEVVMELGSKKERWKMLEKKGN